MPQYDTCYFWSGEACTFDGDCPHQGSNGECNADDDELLTYEDYLQMQESERTKT